MSGNVYKRYVWLLDLINRSNGITLEQISNKWQRCSLNETGERLPPRTFHNHLQKIYDIYGYDTGGYTGEWGPEGRLAMLHQKEIVLNAHDTENFLAGINILRDITSAIDL